MRFVRYQLSGYLVGLQSHNNLEKLHNSGYPWNGESNWLANCKPDI